MNIKSSVTTSFTYHVCISGQVQGVGYRRFLEIQASQRRFTGWVRNLTNGDVEALVQGEKQLFPDFFSALRTGPPASGVSKVEYSPVTAKIFSIFQIVPDCDRFLSVP